MNEAKTEAISNADAHLTNAGLVSYSDLLKLVEESLMVLRVAQVKGAGLYVEKAVAALDQASK
jgi:hypothetical protein